MHTEARRLIASLGLIAHPEGGWYRETYRSEQTVTTARGVARSAATSIYFLLAGGAFSAFHRIASDETWHFYRGDAIHIDVIAPDGTYERRTLGIGDSFATTVLADHYFASHVESAKGYAFVGCDVAPGFEFEDFELPGRDVLVARYPTHAELIARFTRV